MLPVSTVVKRFRVPVFLAGWHGTCNRVTVTWIAGMTDSQIDGAIGVSMAKTTIELPDVLHRKLRVKAAVENRSMNDIVLAALGNYLHNFRVEPDMFEVETANGNHKSDQPVSYGGLNHARRENRPNR